MSTNRLCLLGRPRLLAAGKELPLPEKSYFLLAMALLQVVIDWDGIDPDRELDVNLEKLLGSKAKIAMKDASENLILIDRH